MVSVVNVYLYKSGSAPLSVDFRARAKLRIAAYRGHICWLEWHKIVNVGANVGEMLDSETQ